MRWCRGYMELRVFLCIDAYLTRSKEIRDNRNSNHIHPIELLYTPVIHYHMLHLPMMYMYACIVRRYIYIYTPL